MTRKTLAFAALVLALVMVCGPVFAHHGTSASYDLNKPTQISGTVTEFVWANPHARLFMDVPDEQGKVVNWGVEMRPPPAGLSRIGWTRHTLQPGDKITITVFPSRFGTPTGVGEPDFPILKNGTQLPGTGTGGRRGGGGRGGL